MFSRNPDYNSSWVSVVFKTLTMSLLMWILYTRYTTSSIFLIHVPWLNSGYLFDASSKDTSTLPLQLGDSFLFYNQSCLRHRISKNDGNVVHLWVCIMSQISLTRNLMKHYCFTIWSIWSNISYVIFLDHCTSQIPYIPETLFHCSRHIWWGMSLLKVVALKDHRDIQACRLIKLSDKERKYKTSNRYTRVTLKMLQKVDKNVGNDRTNFRFYA